MRDHRRLRAFELADRLVLAIYAETKTFPKVEQFGLTSQLRRAAVSVASNIVEGCARDSQADYIRFLDIAFGSIREVEYQLTLAQRLGYMSEDVSRDLTQLMKMNLVRQLEGDEPRVKLFMANTAIIKEFMLSDAVPEKDELVEQSSQLDLF